MNSIISKTSRIAGILCLCVLCFACGQGGPAPTPIANHDQLARLQESLDRIEALLSQSGGASAQGAADIQQELAVVQEFLGGSGEGGVPPFASKLERVFAILTESEGEPSTSQRAQVQEEVLAIRSLLEGPAAAGPGGSDSIPAATGGPGSGARGGPGGPGPGGPGPGGSGPGGPGPGGPPVPVGSNSKAPDAKSLELDLERQQRAAQEKVWRARASVTRAAVESTRKAYDQAMSVRPGPGDSPQLIAQAQSAAKAAMEAAEQAQQDLQEEAHRAGVPPGWLR